MAVWSNTNHVRVTSLCCFSQHNLAYIRKRTPMTLTIIISKIYGETQQKYELLLLFRLIASDSPSPARRDAEVARSAEQNKLNPMTLSHIYQTTPIPKIHLYSHFYSLNTTSTLNYYNHYLDHYIVVILKYYLYYLSKAVSSFTKHII